MLPLISNRYRLIRELGRGGMGVVYLARDTARGEQEVVLKTLLPGQAGPADLLRWREELVAGLALRHSGIVQLLDLGTERDVPWLVMELVPGESLWAKLQREGPLPIELVVKIGIGLADALTYAHTRGILHRDLKPHNVMLRPDGKAVLIDLGLCKILNADLRASRSITLSGEVLGTPAFMAPEQVRGESEALGPRTDVYGLGATLYTLLTESAPFPGRNAPELFEQVVNQLPRPMHEVRTDIPPDLECLILQCLAKAPDERPASPAAVKEALLQKEPIARSRRRAPAILAGGLVVCGLSLVAAVIATQVQLPRSASTGVQLRVGAKAEDHHVGAQPPESAPPQDVSARARVLASQARAEAAALHSLGPIVAEAHLRAADEALRLDPSWAWAHQLRGHALLNLGDPEGALGCYQRAHQIEIQCLPPARWYELVMAQRADLLEAAERFLTTELEKMGHETWEAYLYRGLVNERLGSPLRAETDLTSAIGIQPTNGRALAARGTLRYSRGSYLLAEADFDQAWGLTGSPTQLANRGACRLELGRSQEAEEDLREALRRDRRLGHAASWLGTVLFRSDRWEEALHYYQEAIMLDPRDMYSYIGASATLVALSKHDDAIRLLLTAESQVSEEEQHAQLERRIREIARLREEPK